LMVPQSPATNRSPGSPKKNWLSAIPVVNVLRLRFHHAKTGKSRHLSPGLPVNRLPA
jgi:hypothetical protein